jgi:ribosomal protein L32
MAVPKKKVSHRRQRRKLVRYDCDNIVHTYTCQACGKPKMRHRLCDDYEKCAQQEPVKHQNRRAGVSDTSSSASSGAGQKEEIQA